MKRLVAVALSSALLLAACSANKQDSSKDDNREVSKLSEVKVEGDFGSEPKLNVGSKYTGTGADMTKIKEGDGKPLAEGQVARINYVVFDATGKANANTFANAPQYLVLDSKMTEEQFMTGLKGVKEGSRILWSVPARTAPTPTPTATGTASSTTTTAPAKPAQLVVMDIVKTLPMRADGDPQPVKDAAKLPKVDTAPDGSPNIVMPKDNPPGELTTIVLKKGKGAEVKKDQKLTAMYHGVKWAGGEVFDSTFKEMTPRDFKIGAGEVIPGWDKGLVGQTIGSQVLLVVPPKEGYGEQGQPAAKISGTDTLVFLVEILDAN